MIRAMAEPMSRAMVEAMVEPSLTNLMRPADKTDKAR